VSVERVASLRRFCTSDKRRGSFERGGSALHEIVVLAHEARGACNRSSKDTDGAAAKRHYGEEGSEDEDDESGEHYDSLSVLLCGGGGGS
jgi:hypothetical protein